MDDSNIPIDIHTNKLLDWLVTRRHIQKDWQTKVVKIREKINEAIKDMPESDEITALLTGSYINYFHCLKLVEILKETEASSKNVFGQYSSKRMKDWLEIVKLYQKENIYLAEVASLLLRNVNYEVPALKKQIQKTVQSRNECDRKEQEYEKLAETYRKEFSSNCKSLGIKGQKIKKELLEKAADFPQMNKKLSEAIKLLKVPMEFYQKAVYSMLSKNQEVLQMICYIIENGDTTVYQWKYNKVPTSIEVNKVLVEEDEVVDNMDTIDFGMDDAVLDVDDNIDWGISTEESEGITYVKVDDSVAKGEEARTVLGHPLTRDLLINDVLELETFLKIRLYEANTESGSFSSTCPEVLQIYGTKSLQEMLQNVQNVLSNARNTTSIHYLNITTNPRYVHLLTDKLEHKMNMIEKMLASKECVRKQREDIIKDTTALNPKLDLLVKKTRELQDLIEQDISKKYNGRPVNLIAGANLL